MLYRRTIDKQILNINDIKGLPIFSAPLFSGYSEIPRLIVRTTDDGIQLAQVGHDDHELQENEKDFNESFDVAYDSLFNFDKLDETEINQNLSTECSREFVRNHSFFIKKYGIEDTYKKAFCWNIEELIGFAHYRIEGE